jgi:hypothetical protein
MPVSAAENVNLPLIGATLIALQVRAAARGRSLPLLSPPPPPLLLLLLLLRPAIQARQPPRARLPASTPLFALAPRPLPPHRPSLSSATAPRCPARRPP